MGAFFLQEAAKKTYESVGDGCKRAVILTSSLIKEGVKSIEAGANPVLLQEGMNIACELCSSHIYSRASNVCNSTQLMNIAKAAVREETLIDQLEPVLNEMLEGVTISIEDNDGTDIIIEKSKGYIIDNGYISPYLAIGKATIELDKPHIFITNMELSSQKDILPLLEYASLNRVSILILAANVTKEALSVLINNTINGSIKAAAVVPGVYGVSSEAVLEDIAAFTGGEVVDELLWQFNKLDCSMLGKAKKVSVGSNKTIITSGEGNKLELNAYIENLNYRKLTSGNKTEQLVLNNRIVNLTEESIIIKVGAITKWEQQEKKKTVEKAISACNAARISGVIEGGDKLLTKCVDKIKGAMHLYEGDVRTGIYLVLESLSYLIKILSANECCKEGKNVYEGASVIDTVLKTSVSVSTMYLLSKKIEKKC